MIEVNTVGRNGVSDGITKLKKVIDANREHLVGVGRINDGEDNYSFMALFHDKSVIGKHSAVVQEWGTNDGKSGTGGAYFISMNNYLSENRIPTRDMELSASDAQKIGYGEMFEYDILNGDEAKIEEVWRVYADKLKYYFG